MSQEPTGRPDTLLSEAEVRQVLERATSLESGRGSLTVVELTRVAEEAGFGTETISLAIKEILEARDLSRTAQQPLVSTASAPVSPTRGTLTKLPRWKRLLVSAVSGGTLGSLSRLIDGQPSGDAATLFAVIVLVVATLFRAVYHRREGSLEDFQLELAGIWAGFTAGWSLVEGSVWEDLVFSTGTIWLVSAVAGALVIILRRTRGAGGEALPPAGE